MGADGALGSKVADALPRHRDLHYGGEWQRAHGGYAATLDPATGHSLGDCAVIDAADCGNPVAEMTSDVHAACAQLEYFAGLAGEVKGETIPMGDSAVNMM